MRSLRNFGDAPVNSIRTTLQRWSQGGTVPAHEYCVRCGHKLRVPEPCIVCMKADIVAIDQRLDAVLKDLASPRGRKAKATDMGRAQGSVQSRNWHAQSNTNTSGAGWFPHQTIHPNRKK
jgi:hypothetical protein